MHKREPLGMGEKATVLSGCPPHGQRRGGGDYTSRRVEQSRFERWACRRRNRAVKLLCAEAGLAAFFVLGKGIGDEAALDEFGLGELAEVAGFFLPGKKGGAEFV